jgi:phosphate transport system permease protein
MTMMDRKLLKSRAAGEPMVWFTSMGLATGLIMVAFLLTLIIVNGIRVFWPDQVVQIKLKPGSSAIINNSPYLAGKITERRNKIRREVSSKNKLDETEWQLFLGNKDLYGLTFRYVDYKDIAQITYPRGIMSIERMEYGDALGYPESLLIKGHERVMADDPNFSTRLSTLVNEVGRRRQEIKEVERSKIGAINHEMEQLRVQQRLIEKKKRLNSTDQFRKQDIQNRMKVLQVDYELLAQKAQELRELQTENILSYHLVSGERKDLPLGQIVSYYYPNQLSFSGRAILFFENLWNFLSDDPREANTEGGIFPAIFGTCVMTLLLSIAVTPFGVLAAIYLREYAKQGLFVRSVRIAVNNLAGVPSIVFGIFGLGFFVYLVGGTIDRLFFSEYLPAPTFGTGGLLWASLTLALMTVPVVIVATEESLSAVPRGVREGSLACGASKWQTIRRVVLPASAPGILTGLILAMARGAGEVAPLMLVGVVKLAPSLPVDGIFPFIHMDQKFMHLGFYIYDLGFQSPDSEAAKPMVFAVTFFLILLVVALNLGAIIIRERLRKKYSTGAF